MTSTLKSAAATDLDVTALVEGQTADASDVLTPFNEAETEIDTARETLSVSAADTHVKNLEDALQNGNGINWSKVNPAADEKMQAAIDSTVVTTLSGTQTLSNKTLDSSNTVALATIDKGNAAGASPGDVLTWGGTAYAPAPAGGGGALPKDITSIVAGENLAERDAVYLNRSENKWYKIDISPFANVSDVRGIVNESGGFTTGNPGSVRLDGEVSGFSGLTPGAMVYASSTAGGYTQTRPNPTIGVGNNTVVVPLGWAVSATKVLVEPFHRAIYMKRDNLVDQDIIVIEHHADPQGRTRRADAYISVTQVGSSLTTYANSNQDSDVALKKQTTTTYGADQCTGGTASASTESSASFAAGKAVDDVSTGGSYWAANTNTGWWKYDFGTTKTIQRVTVQARDSSPNQSPRTFTIEGSNNDSDWTVLHTLANETGWTVSQVRTYSFTNLTPYRYYRLNVTANDGGALLSIAEIQMLEAATYTDGPDQLAQGFQLAATNPVAAIRLWLKKTGTPSGNLTVKILADSGGDPAGGIIETSTVVDAATLTGSYAWIEFAFTAPPTLSGSTQYHIVLETTSGQSPINFVEWGADASAPGYSGGEMKSNSGTWTAESKDAVFDVLAEGAALEEPANGGWSNDGAPRVVVRYDDSIGTNTDIYTSFKNISGVTLDLTVIVEL